MYINRTRVNHQIIKLIKHIPSLHIREKLLHNSIRPWLPTKSPLVLLNSNNTNCVQKAVFRRLLCVKGIWKYVELRSSTEKITAPENWSKACSIGSVVYESKRTLAFKLQYSTTPLGTKKSEFEYWYFLERTTHYSSISFTIWLNFFNLVAHTDASTSEP